MLIIFLLLRPDVTSLQTIADLTFLSCFTSLINIYYQQIGTDFFSIAFNTSSLIMVALLSERNADVIFFQGLLKLSVQLLDVLTNSQDTANAVALGPGIPLARPTPWEPKLEQTDRYLPTTNFPNKSKVPTPA